MTPGKGGRPLSLGALRAVVGVQIAAVYLTWGWSIYQSGEAELRPPHRELLLISVIVFPYLGIVLHALLRRGRQGPVIGLGRTMSYQARTLLAAGLTTAVAVAICTYGIAERRAIAPWAILSALVLRACWPRRQDLQNADSAARNSTASIASPRGNT